MYLAETNAVYVAPVTVKSLSHKWNRDLAIQRATDAKLVCKSAQSVSKTVTTASSNQQKSPRVNRKSTETVMALAELNKQAPNAKLVQEIVAKGGQEVANTLLAAAVVSKSIQDVHTGSQQVHETIHAALLTSIAETGKPEET